MVTTELVLGGARSGKSRLAEQLAMASGLKVVYVATATADDDEMAERIERHQQDRPAEWLLVEEPVDLARVIRTYNKPEYCVLIDCLTLWLTNCLFNDDFPQPWAEHKSELLVALADAQCRVIMVSNEVGQGIVPLGQVSRQFVDQSGWLHQAIAQQVDRVTFVTAGLSQVLKGPAFA